MMLVKLSNGAVHQDGQVKARLCRVNVGKADGPDCVVSWVLNTFYEELVSVLSDVF